MTSLSRERILALAELGRLELDDEAVTRMQRELEAILELVEQLSELDLDDVPPTTHAIPLNTAWREDAETRTLTSSQALSNAPDARNGYFAVPRHLPPASE